MREYCLKWKLEVNVSKTKIIVFNSNRRLSHRFNFGTESIDIVTSFRYLGIEFSQSGTFFKARKSIYDHAQRAIFSLLQTARKQELPLCIILDMYQKMIVPILTYGCEIWGHENLDILEKLQMKFLKMVFRLNRQTMSAMILGELGIYPISVLIKCRMMRFWSGIIDNSSTNKISSRLYSILFNLCAHKELVSKWLNNIQSILVENGYDCVWSSQFIYNKGYFRKNIDISIKQNFIKSWEHALEESTKCIFYKSIKGEFCREQYIKQLPDALIFPLIKFRCGNHKLQIEIGRREGEVRGDRVCRECSMNSLGDEFHFILQCPKFTLLRNEFIPKKYRSCISMFNLCNLFRGNRNHQVKLSKFIKKSKVV